MFNNLNSFPCGKSHPNVKQRFGILRYQMYGNVEIQATWRDMYINRRPAMMLLEVSDQPKKKIPCVSERETSKSPTNEWFVFTIGFRTPNSDRHLWIHPSVRLRSVKGYGWDQWRLRLRSPTNKVTIMVEFNFQPKQPIKFGYTLFLLAPHHSQRGQSFYLLGS